MPILVHLTSHKNIQKILRSGIVGACRNIYCKLEQQELYKEIGKAVYCMPVLPNYYISHQWLRELKRGGQNNFVGIYFKLDSQELVWLGHYNQPHIQVSVNQAIDVIMHNPDPRGYEVIVPRAIKSNEIHKVKHLPQVLGWRYYPEAHSNKPNCACPMCLPLGSIKSRKLRERLEPPEKRQSYPVLIEELKAAENSQIIIDILYNIYSTVRGGNKNQAADLQFLINHPTSKVIEALADTLGAYRGNAINILLKLCVHEDDNCRKASARSLLEILNQNAFICLDDFRNDKVILEVLEDYINDNNLEVEIEIN